jgi:membrane protease subunit HflK
MSDEHDHIEAAPSQALLDAPEEASTQALSEALRSSFTIIKIIMVVLVGLFLLSGFFQVGTQEKAVILRFGRPVGEDRALLGPGPHFAWPYPIDEVVKIPIGQIQSVSSTVGWYASSPGQEAANAEPPPRPSLNPANDGYMLTGDGNIIHVRGTLLYRITEPAIRYIFDFSNASNLVQNIFNNALNYSACSYNVDNVLTRDVAGFREKVRARVEQLASQYQLGITIDQINLQSIPPRQLAAAFSAVLEAEVRRSTVLNDARSYANQTVSRARAEAEALKNAGENDRNRLVEFVQAEARQFEDLLPAYQSNPSLFIQQRHLATLQKVLTNAVDKYFVPNQAGGKPLDIRVLLNREQKAIKALEPPPNEDHH